MIPESQIGKNIKALRLSRKLTLETLAGKAGLTKGYLSKVENSKKSPPVSTLIVIAKALGVTLSRIFGEESTAIRCSVVKKEDRLFMAKSGTALWLFIRNTGPLLPEQEDGAVHSDHPGRL